MSHTFNHPGFFSTWHQSDKKYGNVESEPIPIMYRANDPILHTDATPFCDDARCPCHCLANSGQTFIETIEQPIADGLLTTAEGLRLYWGEQI